MSTVTQNGGGGGGGCVLIASKAYSPVDVVFCRVAKKETLRMLYFFLFYFNAGLRDDYVYK